MTSYTELIPALLQRLMTYGQSLSARTWRTRLRRLHQARNVEPVLMVGLCSRLHLREVHCPKCIQPSVGGHYINASRKEVHHFP